MGDIKEIRDAALAYYHNFSAKEQHEAYLFFQTMDKDDDGKITMEDFKQKFEGCFGDNVNRAFQDLDKNGDGSLDYEESITLYYCLMAGRIIICHCCKAFFLKGLYFTCVDCFKHNQTTTFDLCISCYDSSEYALLRHEHCNFLDNYALLATYRLSGLTNQPASSAKSDDPKKASSAKSDDPKKASSSKSDDPKKASSSKSVNPKNYQFSQSTSGTLEAVRAVNNGVEAVNNGVEAVNNGLEMANHVGDILDVVGTIGNIAACTIM